MLYDQYNESQNIDPYIRYNGTHESRTIYSIKLERGFSEKGIIYLENQFIIWNNPGFNPKIPYIKKKHLEKFSFNIGFDFYMKKKF